MNLVIEINGKSIERVTIEKEGITIGRSLNNDLIIQDRYVDPKQIRLTLDGDQLLVEDLNSVNGTEIDGLAIKGDSHHYSYGSQISIGDTVLRVMEEGADVDQTVVRSFWFHLIRSFRSWPLLCLLVFLVGALNVLRKWSYSTQVYNFADGFSHFFSNALTVIGVVICFAVLNKIVKGRSSFREYVVVVSFIFIIELIVDFIVLALRFNWQEPVIGEMLPIIVSGFIDVLLILSALSYMTQLSRYKMIFLSMFFAAMWTYKEHAAEFGKEDYEKWSKYSNTENILFPPEYLFSKPGSINKHFDQMDGLFEAAKSEE